MNTELENMKQAFVAGRMDRRTFLGRAATMGFSALAANTVLFTNWHTTVLMKRR